MRPTGGKPPHQRRAAASFNKALDPTAVSVSDFMRFDFTEFSSYREGAAPAVGQLGRSAGKGRSNPVRTVDSSE